MRRSGTDGNSETYVTHFQQKRPCSLDGTCDGLTVVPVHPASFGQPGTTSENRRVIHSRRSANVQAAIPKISIVCSPVGLALYGRSSRKSVGSPEAVPLRSALPTSGIVNI
eukprot:2120682-Pleurochrysis_carterae.AAC.1